MVTLNCTYVHTHNFNHILYYRDSIHYHDMLLYYCDSGKFDYRPAQHIYV